MGSLVRKSNENYYLEKREKKIMRNLYYDAKGDILTVTFCESPKETGAGIELHENIVLYFIPEQEKAIELILISYGALLKTQHPLLMEVLPRLQPDWQQNIISMIQKEPVANFLHIEHSESTPVPSLYVKKVFDPEIMKVAA